MRILFLSPRQCWPARGGAKLREYHFARALAERGDLTYLYFSDPGAQPLTRRDLPFCREIIAVPKPKPYSFVSLLQGVVGSLPLTVANYVSTEMSAAFEKVLGSGTYDLIHLESIHMVSYGQSAIGRGHRVVNNWHNIESEAMRRYAAMAPSPGRRWYAGLTASKLAACELDFLKTSFGNVVCSEREKEQLHQLVPSARIAVVENGVDTQSFTQGFEGSARLSSKQLSGKLVFVGLMDYYPNVEAAISFSRNIWPRIREKFPEMSLWMVGANPTPAVAALGALPGVTVTGTVPDVRPYYQDAEAAIVPLRTGGGTRLKILEAMAAGVPIISTPLGAEGLAVTPGKDILFAEVDSPETWISQLSALRQNAAYPAGLVEQALELARSRYDWRILGRTLCETYEGWLRSGA